MFVREWKAELLSAVPWFGRQGEGCGSNKSQGTQSWQNFSFMPRNSCQALGKTCLYFFCDLKGNNPLFLFTGDLFTPEENTGCYYDVKWDVCMWLNNCSFQHSLLLELLAWLQPAGALWMCIRPWYSAKATLNLSVKFSFPKSKHSHGSWSFLAEQRKESLQAGCPGWGWW